MNSPVIVDRTLLWALTVNYLIFGFWGVTSFFAGIKTIELTGGEAVQEWYALIVSLVSFVVAPLPLMGISEVLWEKVEKYATIVWAGFISVYTFTLLYQILLVDPAGRVQLFILSFTFTCLPIWRITFLFRKHLNSDA